MLFVELAEFSTFIALLDFYISGVLVLVFIETCVKLYFSQKITFKNIIEYIINKEKDRTIFYIK